MSPVVGFHYNDVIMGSMASRITSLTIVYSTIYSGADQRKHQSSASLAFVRGIHRGPVNSPHKGPVTRNWFHLMTSSFVPRERQEHVYLILSISWPQGARAPAGMVLAYFSLLLAYYSFSTRRIKPFLWLFMYVLTSAFLRTCSYIPAYLHLHDEFIGKLSVYWWSETQGTDTCNTTDWVNIRLLGSTIWGLQLNLTKHIRITRYYWLNFESNTTHHLCLHGVYACVPARMRACMCVHVCVWARETDLRKLVNTCTLTQTQLSALQMQTHKLDKYKPR